MSRLGNFLTFWLKNELKTVIALGVLLVVLVSFSLAVGASYKFDFGDGAASGLETGYLPVDGSASMYPTVASGISGLQYGWLDEILEFSDGAAVGSKLNRDGNRGVEPSRFKIVGLDNGNYTVSLVSGSLDNGFSTKVTTAGKSYTATTLPNEWKTLTFGAEVTGSSLELLFQRAGMGTNLWAVNALTIVPAVAPAPKPTFDVTVQPIEHTVRAGGSAIYRISLNPLNGYASSVNLSVGGLVGGISAGFSPAAAIPPFVSNLTVTSAKVTPVTKYDFVITARGEDADAYTLNKSISLLLTDNPQAPTIARPEDGTGTTDGQGDTGTLDGAYLEPRTREDVRQEQILIDEFAKEETKKLASAKEMLEIKDISTINAFPVELPVLPKTAFEASLQYFTTAGIIGTAVDSAPPAAAAEPVARMGLWERFLKTMTNPAL